MNNNLGKVSIATSACIFESHSVRKSISVHKAAAGSNPHQRDLNLLEIRAERETSFYNSLSSISVSTL